MKGLVKEFAIFALTLIISYFLFTKTSISNYFQNFLTGFFSLFYSKEEKIIYFEILIQNTSDFEINGKIFFESKGSIKNSIINSISLNQLKDESNILISCFDEKCKIKKVENSIEFEGLAKEIIFDKKFSISNEKGISTKIFLEDFEYLNISILSPNTKICASEFLLNLEKDSKKLSQKIQNDCIEIYEISKIVLKFDENELKIFGYSNTLKSFFVQI